MLISYHVSLTARTVYKKKDKKSGVIYYSDTPDSGGWVKEKLKGNLVIEPAKKKKRKKTSLKKIEVPSTLPTRKINVVEEKRFQSKADLESSLKRFEALKSQLSRAKSKRRMNPTRRNKEKLRLLEDEFFELKRVWSERELKGYE